MEENGKNAGIFTSYRFLHVQILGKYFLKNFLLIFSNFQKNADIRNSKKKFFSFFHDLKSFKSFQEPDFLDLTLT